MQNDDVDTRYRIHYFEKTKDAKKWQNLLRMQLSATILTGVEVYLQRTRASTELIGSPAVGIVFVIAMARLVRKTKACA